jgi:L-alanine-DL-glutamate epimerase-like enolase superfamily enzyme
MSSEKPISIQPASNDPAKDRRSFFKKVTLGGLGMGMFMQKNLHAEEVDFITQNVSRFSSPSQLRITDLRIAKVKNTPIIKIYTNQDIYGLGEVRDGASPTYALMLKSRILGRNPCNVEQIFNNIKQFGNHGRQAGGVCGIEMALWDLAGKAYGVPVYQMLGGKFRDKIRIYSGAGGRTAEETGLSIKKRMDEGFTFVKIRVWPAMLKDVPGSVVGAYDWDYTKPYDREWMGYGQVPHPFNRMKLTEKGIDFIADFIATIRQVAGWEIPIGVDHLGHFEHNTIIRLGKALDKYRLAFLEDLVPWFYHDQLKEITDAIETPTITGEDIYLKEEFKKLCDNHIVDIVHPDLASAGGILETKKIGDYAEERGIPMFLHFAGTPVSLMANVHSAAATQNVVALEYNSYGRQGYEDLVTKIPKPIVDKGYIRVPDTPGLGIDLNDEVLKDMIKDDKKIFPPTDEWNDEKSWDRIWS